MITYKIGLVYEKEVQKDLCTNLDQKNKQRLKKRRRNTPQRKPKISLIKNLM